jgi:pimeloyl-ACP methyl ester carboxylesterase
VVGVSGGGPDVAACSYKIPESIKEAGIVVGLGPVHIKNAFKGVSWYGKIGWENYKYSFIRKTSAFISFIESRFIPEIFMNVTYGAIEDKKLLSNEYRRDMMLTFKEAYRQGIKGPEWDLRIYSSKWGFRVSEIKTKISLWYGECDKNVSVNMGKYYASHIKGSKLTVYPNEGHMVFHNHAEEILRELL